MNNSIKWTDQQEPVGLSLDQLLYRIRQSDASSGLILDSITLAEILDDDGVERYAFDALVFTYSLLRKKMDILLRTMNRAGGDVQVSAMQVSDPFKRNGVAQVAAVFEMSDGQTVTVYFHNPDHTPGRLAPRDEMISWKWLLNKKDITIIVAPERGNDIAIREVARRIMKLTAKNSAAFAKTNAKRAERLEAIGSMKAEISSLELELEDLNKQIEVKQVEQESAALHPRAESIKDGLSALAAIKGFLSRSQYSSIKKAISDEGGEHYVDKAKLLASVIDGMADKYAQESQGMADTAHIHYQGGAANWYVTAGGLTAARGLVDTGAGGELTEITISDVTNSGAELDLNFEPKVLSAFAKEAEPELTQEPELALEVNASAEPDEPASTEQEPESEDNKSELEAAREETDTNPTEAEKESGDYSKGELSAFGLDLVIENPKGHVRSGKSGDGVEWSVSMAHDYGYIKGTKGLDGDEVDVFIGPYLESETAYLIEQVDLEGKLDEHKVMLGFNDEAGASQGYLSSYKPGWNGLGSIKSMTLDELKAWLLTAGTAAKGSEALAQALGDPWEEFKVKLKEDQTKNPVKVEAAHVPDEQVILEALSYIERQIGLKLKADDYFTGIKNTQAGLPYFNVETDSNTSEGPELDALSRLASSSKTILKVEPNGQKRLAIFLHDKPVDDAGVITVAIAEPKIPTIEPANEDLGSDPLPDLSQASSTVGVDVRSGATPEERAQLFNGIKSGDVVIDINGDQYLVFSKSEHHMRVTGKDGQMALKTVGASYFTGDQDAVKTLMGMPDSITQGLLDEKQARKEAAELPAAEPAIEEVQPDMPVAEPEIATSEIVEPEAAIEAPQAEPVTAEPDLSIDPDVVPEPEVDEPEVTEPLVTPAEDLSVEISQDKAFLELVISGEAPDMLSPDLGDEIAAILERNTDNPEFEPLLEQAVMAYQKAMEQATNDLSGE